MFIVQACRAKEKTEPGVDSSAASSSIATNDSFPDQSDYLVVNSTLPDKYAYRHSKKGSWLIYYLCQIIDKKPSQRFTDIVTMVNATMKKKLESGCEKYQICEQVSALTKKVILSPN